MKKVAAAILEQDGKYLIAQRKEGDTLAGKWEFPGGKIEEGETAENCLVREFKEEFDVEIDVGEYFCSSKFEYKHLPIELLVYFGKWKSGDFKLNDHARIEWVDVQQMGEYDFASADIPVVKKLVSQIEKLGCVMITKEQALEIATCHSGHGKEYSITDGVPENCNIYDAPKNVWCVLCSANSTGVIALQGRHAILIDKVTGKILYDGDVGDEG